jgi:hypothetical protein
MERMRALVLVVLIGCSTPAVAVQPDARLGDDAARVDDAGTDAAPEIDAALEGDAGSDGGHDAGVDAFVAVDAATWGTCDLYTNDGCVGAMTCRRADDGNLPHLGAPHCEPNGTTTEGTGTASCIDGDTGHDLCGGHLYCADLFTCTRYCDATHDTCVVVHGSPTHCDTAAVPPHCVP